MKILKSILLHLFWLCVFFINLAVACFAGVDYTGDETHTIWSSVVQMRYRMDFVLFSAGMIGCMVAFYKFLEQQGAYQQELNAQSISINTKTESERLEELISECILSEHYELAAKFKKKLEKI